jgi:soluble lytic murein transglycosylase-like protein
VEHASPAFNSVSRERPALRSAVVAAAVLLPGVCLSQAWPPAIQGWGGIILSAARANRLDPNLLAAQIWTESRGLAQAGGKAGEVGLMQVVPSDNVSGLSFASRPTRAELADPVYNINWGAAKMRELISTYDDARTALAVYQCGGRNWDEGKCASGLTYADIILGRQQAYAGACWDGVVHEESDRKAMP